MTIKATLKGGKPCGCSAPLCSCGSQTYPTQEMLGTKPGQVVPDWHRLAQQSG